MIGHYVRRFFTSLSRRPPSPADEIWAESLVSPAAYALFARLSNTDRRHLVQSARIVAAELPAETDRVWVQAALLHDVGKFDAHLDVLGRVAATVAATVVGNTRSRGWAGSPRWRGPLGTYQCHDVIGAVEIRAVGGPEEAAVWSELHHHPDQFADATIPPAVLRVLDAADH